MTLTKNGCLSQNDKTVVCFSDAKAGIHLDKGWPNSCYGVSKVGVTVMSIIQQREFDSDSKDLVVNAVSSVRIQCGLLCMPCDPKICSECL